ncbi:hypothetical protein K435DRAFT_72494 [Dendrothele bispora CBS 962.96]|uniref:Uncharacterized protein n=1 Tax=Dendrothele bispora (strain CBS 962.96) TaxID=1314807 RepID=A0A4V4HB38_DENBC|nr:hypothetical protein K435DRAFT_72494 [Dendrothele bispora CBS 962.96]
MKADPIAPVPSPASLPDTCNHNYAIGSNSGYGVDMTAIGATTPVAGLAGTRVARTRSVRTTANAGGNMDMHTESLNIPNNPPPLPPMLTAPTTFNLVASPFDFPEPAPAVSVSQAYGGISVWMTASFVHTVVDTKRFSVFGDPPTDVGMSQSNVSSSSFKQLRGSKGRSVCNFFMVLNGNGYAVRF